MFELTGRAKEREELQRREERALHALRRCQEQLDKEYQRGYDQASEDLNQLRQQTANAALRVMKENEELRTTLANNANSDRPSTDTRSVD